MYLLFLLLIGISCMISKTTLQSLTDNLEENYQLLLFAMIFN